MIEGGLNKLQETKLEPAELVHVANVARAVSAIRARPKSKDDMDYESLLEKARADPELMSALTATEAQPERQREREDDDGED